MTNVNNLIRRFGKAYFPNQNIKVVSDDIESISENIDSQFPESIYNKYNGFLFPLLMFESNKNTYKLYDGNHRYAYALTHNTIILSIVIKPSSTYEMIIPISLLEGTNYVRTYNISIGGIQCSKIICSSLHDFRAMFISFTDLLYRLIRVHDEWNFRANELVNRNSKLLDASVAKNDYIAPKFQYTNETGIIQHHSDIHDKTSEEVIRSLYDIYVANMTLLANDSYFFIDKNNILDIEISNSEWWDGVSYAKQSLIYNINTNGIYLPIIYTKDNNIYTIGDGFHRFIVCRSILLSSNCNSSKRYLMIPDIIETNCTIDLRIPKFIYDRYSYLLKARMISEVKGPIESYVVTIDDPGSIRTIRLLLERELNNIIDSGLFKKYNIKAAKIFNGGKL